MFLCLSPTTSLDKRLVCLCPWNLVAGQNRLSAKLKAYVLRTLISTKISKTVSQNGRNPMTEVKDKK